jgi:fatty-acid desaturase
MTKNNFTKEELENSNRIQKSATPKYTLDWYVKWVASIFVLAGMAMRGVEGLQLYDLIASTLGVTLWLVVSILWKDRALIVLNGAGLLFLIRNLVIQLTGL